MELYICESSGWSDLLKKQPGLDSNGSGEGSDSCHHFTKPNTGFSRESIPSWPGAILRARRSGNNGYTDTGTVWTCRATWKGYRSEWSPRPPCSVHSRTRWIFGRLPNKFTPLYNEITVHRAKRPIPTTSTAADLQFGAEQFFSHPVHLFSKDVKRTERTIYKRRRAGWNSSALVSVADSRTSGADRRGNTRPKERKPVGRCRGRGNTDNKKDKSTKGSLRIRSSSDKKMKKDNKKKKKKTRTRKAHNKPVPARGQGIRTITACCNGSPGAVDQHQFPWLALFSNGWPESIDAGGVKPSHHAHRQPLLDRLWIPDNLILSPFRLIYDPSLTVVISSMTLMAFKLLRTFQQLISIRERPYRGRMASGNSTAITDFPSWILPKDYN
ncbi:unnamed protein product [Nesidiocoris tenuis]|uniref:Uncharacterized protein n=1 Tax=Nesidiocoris tenuis TaxID=355587 RepID=A0A6H5H1G6_9HEMI|nr:unnamed protein product [Nesidiocoris tenuis]